MKGRTFYGSIIALVGWLVLSYVAAATGGAATATAGDFYQQLSQPEWAPPSWLFGPVWGVLYTAMGVAAWLAWRERERTSVATALWLFVVQLAVNALWSWLFFAWRLGAAAFAEILLLAVLIILTIIAFARIRTFAAWLLIPYLLWVCFAAALNYSLWQRNAGLLG